VWRNQLSNGGDTIAVMRSAAMTRSSMSKGPLSSAQIDNLHLRTAKSASEV